ncbi:MAG: sarcosine oxidase subunit gamma [Proteobacteria bacterium]|nr:sarcosine oxidase subunit gamma [Pseudomonadota bacterium]
MTSLRHQPLAHLALAARREPPVADAGVTLRALPYRPSIILRGESGDAGFVAAFRAGMGFELPLDPNRISSHDGVTALWLGPSEWLILGAMGPAGQGRLATALTGHHHAIINNGDGQQIIALSGPRARDVLGKLCPLDLESPDLAPGHCARSILARCSILLHPQPDGAYHIHVGRSFADYAWRLLADAGLTYGVAVASGD